MARTFTPSLTHALTTMSKHDCGQQQLSLDRTPDTADAIRNMHDIFLDPYRCAVLHYLQQTDGAVTLRDLAATIDDRSPNGDRAEKEYGERPHTWLRDKHLLQMDEFGVLVYDRDENVVQLPDDVSFSVTPPWTTDEP